MNERSTKSEPTTQDNGALHFGPTAGAATPAAVEAAMPQRDGAAQRRGDIASLVYVAEVEISDVLSYC